MRAFIRLILLSSIFWTGAPSFAQPVPLSRGIIKVSGSDVPTVGVDCTSSGAVSAANVPARFAVDGANKGKTYCCVVGTGLWEICADPADGSGAGHTIKDEGTPLTQRAGLNFTGAGVQCVDDGGGNQTTCNVTGGGGGVSDGDKGDVVVSGSGAVWTVESAAADLVVVGTVDARIVHTVGDDIPSQVAFYGEHYNDSTRPIIAMIRGRGTIPAPTDVQDQDILGDWQAQGLHGGANRASANIRMKVAAPWATNDYPAKIEFDLTGPGESARSTRMTLDASGLTLPGAVTAGSLVGPLTGTASGNLVTADINTFSELDAIVADKALVNKTDGAIWTGAHDYGGATLEIPNSASLPGTCVVGQLYMDTDATSGQRIYACQATNTWVLQGDGGGGGSGDVTGVGDCTGGDCLDGTSDGGTTITLYNAGGNVALLAGAATLDISTPVTATSFTADDPGDGFRGVDLIDNSTVCPDPASGSTSVCTIGGRVYRRDTGGSSLLQLEAVDIDTSAELATILGDETGTAGGFTRSSATVLRNSSLVTVCASGCDYATVQAALDGTTGTATNPVTILIMPGTYDECVNIDDADDYKTLQGVSRDAVTIQCGDTEDEATIECVSVSDGFNLIDFAIRDLTVYSQAATGSRIAIACNVGIVTSGSQGARFDLTLSDLRVLNGNVGINLRAWSGGFVGTLAPSEAVLSRIEYDGKNDGVYYSGDLRVWARDNTWRCKEDTVRWGTGDLAHCVTWLSTSRHEASRFESYNESCYAKNGKIDGTVNGGFRLVTIPEFAYIYNATIEITADPTETVGLHGFSVSNEIAAGGSGVLVIDSSVVRYATSGASQLGTCIRVEQDGRVIAKNVHCESGGGPGTETDIYFASNSSQFSWIRFETLKYDTIAQNGSGKFQALSPHILRSMLPAFQAVALPAPGAPLDVNGEFRVFDAATDEFASWRNLRVSPYFNADSLSAPKARVFWRPTTATSGDVVWRVGFCVVVEGDPFPCAVSSFASITDSMTGGVAGDLQVTSSLTLSSGLVADRGLVVTVTRDADNGSDTLAGDAEMIGVEIAYGVR